MKINRRDLSPPRIEMLPLIDVVFLLLVFFIYAMLSMAVHYGQPVNLPTSSSTTLEPHEAITVSIQSNDQNVVIFLDKEQVSLEVLENSLREKQVVKNGDQENQVQIFADKSVSYQKLFQVLDRIKQAGITSISLQAEPEGLNP